MEIFNKYSLIFIAAIEINPILAEVTKQADKEVREAAMILANLNQSTTLEEPAAQLKTKMPQIVDANVANLIEYFKTSKIYL